MESLVYEDSPLADYLEGKLQLFPRIQKHYSHRLMFTGEGERDQDWTPLQVETNGDAHSQNFAPKGIPTIQTRVRDTFAAASDKNSSQEQGTGVFGRIHHTCSVCHEPHNRLAGVGHSGLIIVVGSQFADWKTRQ